MRVAVENEARGVIFPVLYRAEHLLQGTVVNGLKDGSNDPPPKHGPEGGEAGSQGLGDHP